MEINKSLEASIKLGLRSIAASFPVAASLAQVWNEYENRIQLKRIEECFGLLKDHIASMESRLEKAEKYILESGEVPTLIEKTFQKLRTEPSPSKRESFVFLLAESIAVGYDVPYESKYSFLEILDTLTEYDINILMKFKGTKKLRGTDLIDAAKVDREEHASNIIMSLTKLESRGLIAETDPIDYSGDTSIGGSGSEGHWMNRWRSKYLCILPSGSVFLNMIYRKKYHP
jgi:hypothetical protein